MKRIFYFFFLLVLNLNITFASEIFYTDYSSFSEYSEESVLASDTLDVISIDKYLWYKEDIKLLDYDIYNKDFLFTDDCYFSSYSIWDTYKKSEYYIERDVFHYKMVRPVRYIYLTNLKGSYGGFRIPELNVFIDGVSIDYDFYCNDCSLEFGDYIHNGSYNENKSYLKNGSYLVIDLKREYPIDDIELNFYMFDMGNDEKKYTLGFADSSNEIYMSKDYGYFFREEYCINSKNVIHNSLEFDSSLWTYEIDSYDSLDNPYIIDESVSKEYSSRDLYCRKYEIYNNYYPYYSYDSIDDFNIKDNNSKTTFYSYRTRNKLEISDDLVVNDYKFDLNNFILYSNEEVVIESDIDLYKNGLYDITFKTDSFTIERKVLVKIVENEINYYNDLIDKLNYEYYILNNRYNELSVKYNEDILKLENELKNCKEDCNFKEECLNKLISLKDEELSVNYEEINKLSNKINFLNSEITKLVDENSSLNEGLKSNLLEFNNEVERLNIVIDNLSYDYDLLKEKYDILSGENNKDKYLDEIKKISEELLNSKNMYENEVILNLEYFNKIITLESLNELYKNKIYEIENQIDESFTEEVSLSDKLNNYMLNINGKDKFNMFYIYLAILFIFVYLILKRKSNKK